MSLYQVLQDIKRMFETKEDISLTLSLPSVKQTAIDDFVEPEEVDYALWFGIVGFYGVSVVEAHIFDVLIGDIYIDEATGGAFCQAIFIDEAMEAARRFADGAGFCRGVILHVGVSK